MQTRHESASRMCFKAVVGIDLAGVETRPTGFCVLDRKLNCETKIIYSNSEILKEIDKIKPAIVAIDAPLALPKDRKSLTEKSKIHLRECDKELLRMGIKFFPITLGPMRKLTERGIGLRKIIEKKGFEVIETYPGAAQDILNIPRKQKGLMKLKNSLKKLGLKGLTTLNADELDAVTCALVGKMYIQGNYLAVGDSKEILMILPKERR